MEDLLYVLLDFPQHYPATAAGLFLTVVAVVGWALASCPSEDDE